MASTITHEVGHCLGLDGHTADGGLMDKTARSANVIAANVSPALNLLYWLPPAVHSPQPDLTQPRDSQISKVPAA